jgi:hypothetical protein
VMQIFLLSKSLYDLFSDLHGKDSKTLIWQGQKQHLRNKEKQKFEHHKLLYRTKSETRCAFDGKHTGLSFEAGCRRNTTSTPYSAAGYFLYIKDKKCVIP